MGADKRGRSRQALAARATVGRTLTRNSCRVFGLQATCTYTHTYGTFLLWHGRADLLDRSHCNAGGQALQSAHPAEVHEKAAADSRLQTQEPRTDRTRSADAGANRGGCNRTEMNSHRTLKVHQMPADQELCKAPQAQVGSTEVHFKIAPKEAAEEEKNTKIAFAPTGGRTNTL